MSPFQYATRIGAHALLFPPTSRGAFGIALCLKIDYSWVAVFMGHLGCQWLYASERMQHVALDGYEMRLLGLLVQ